MVSELEEDIIRKENYRPNSKQEVKIFNKFLGNWIKQLMKN